jgi:coenzyme F420-reducing hydrogenase delta subunit
MEKLVSLSRVTDIIWAFEVWIQKDVFYEIIKEIELLPIHISNEWCCKEDKQKYESEINELQAQINNISFSL